MEGEVNAVFSAEFLHSVASYMVEQGIRAAQAVSNWRTEC